MSESSPEVDAAVVVQIQRNKMSELEWQNTVLQAQLQEAGARLAESAHDRMRIRQLELQIEELQAGTQGGQQDE